MRLQAQPRAGVRGEPQLLRRPRRPLRRIGAHLRRREPAERIGIGRMTGEQLALQVRRQFGDRDAVARQLAAQVVAVVLALRRERQVEQRRIRRRHLDADVAEARRPLRHAFERVERRLRRGELREENRRTLHAEPASNAGSSRQRLWAAELATAASMNAMPRSAASMPCTFVRAASAPSPHHAAAPRTRYTGCRRLR